jgi:toxin ParE1/3/4
LKFSLHPAAEQDVAQALDFYREQAGSPVAQHFLAEFERVARLLVRHPELGTPAARGRRTFPMRLFPYSLVYRVTGSEVRVLVVRHQRRKPGFGGVRR